MSNSVRTEARGSSRWIEAPQTGIAFGSLHFGFLPRAKWLGLRLPGTSAAGHTS